MLENSNETFSRNDILTWINDLLKVSFFEIFNNGFMFLGELIENRTIKHRSSLLSDSRHSLPQQSPFE